MTPIVKGTPMKKRTATLLRWITVLGIILLLGALPGLPSWKASTVYGWVLILIVVISARLTKAGSKYGWWILTLCIGFSSISICCFLVGKMMFEFSREGRFQVADIVPAMCSILLFGGILGVLPVALLVTDPPWKWESTRSDRGPSTASASNAEPVTPKDPDAE